MQARMKNPAAMVPGAVQAIQTLMASTQKAGAPPRVLQLVHLRASQMKTSRPAHATTGNPLLDRLATISHYGFYLLIVLMVGTGFATAILSGLNLIVFGPSHTPFPPNLMIYASFVAHLYIASILIGLITLHVLAALYHQFVLKDGLLRRMFFGHRMSGPVAPAE